MARSALKKMVKQKIIANTLNYIDKERNLSGSNRLKTLKFEKTVTSGVC